MADDGKKEKVEESPKKEEEDKGEKKKLLYYASLPIGSSIIKGMGHVIANQTSPGDVIKVEAHPHISLHVQLPHMWLSQKAGDFFMDPFEVVISKMEVWENKDKDIVVLRIQDSDHVNYLHGDMVAEYEQPWPHGEYNPHITLVMFKPGTIKKTEKIRKFVDAFNKGIESQAGRPAIVVTMCHFEYREHGGDNKLHATVHFDLSKGIDMMCYKEDSTKPGPDCAVLNLPYIQQQPATEMAAEEEAIR